MKWNENSIWADFQHFKTYSVYTFVAIGYQQIQERTETEGYVYYANQTISNLGNARYLTELAGPDKYALNDGFVSDSCRLPGTYSENEYMTFLDTWGTVRNRQCIERSSSP